MNDPGSLRRLGVRETVGLVAWTGKSGPHVIRHGLRFAALLGLCLMLAACGTPVSVERMDARTVGSELTSKP